MNRNILYFFTLCLRNTLIFTRYALFFLQYTHTTNDNYYCLQDGSYIDVSLYAHLYASHGCTQ